MARGTVPPERQAPDHDQERRQRHYRYRRHYPLPQMLPCPLVKNRPNSSYIDRHSFSSNVTYHGCADAPPQPSPPTSSRPRLTPQKRGQRSPAVACAATTTLAASSAHLPAPPRRLPAASACKADPRQLLLAPFPGLFASTLPHTLGASRASRASRGRQSPCAGIIAPFVLLGRAASPARPGPAAAAAPAALASPAAASAAAGAPPRCSPRASAPALAIAAAAAVATATTEAATAVALIAGAARAAAAAAATSAAAAVAPLAATAAALADLAAAARRLAASPLPPVEGLVVHSPLARLAHLPLRSHERLGAPLAFRPVAISALASRLRPVGFSGLVPTGRRAVRPRGPAAEAFALRGEDVHAALRACPIAVSGRGRSRLSTGSLLLLRLWRWLLWHLAVLLAASRLILRRLEGLPGVRRSAVAATLRGWECVGVWARSGKVALLAALVACSIGNCWLTFRAAPCSRRPRGVAPEARTARGEDVHATGGARPITWAQGLVPRAHVCAALVICGSEALASRLSIVTESLHGSPRHHAALTGSTALEGRIASSAAAVAGEVASTAVAAVAAVSTEVAAHAAKASEPTISAKVPVTSESATASAVPGVGRAVAASARSGARCTADAAVSPARRLDGTSLECGAR